MCRLLGYATAGANASLEAVLGTSATRRFGELSEIHNDGWGTALLSVPAVPPGVADGGAPTPETGVKLYKGTIAARHDPLFADFAAAPARGAIWHLRLASSNLPLIMENQQPFYASGLSFIHNGDISDEHGVNIVHNDTYPVSQGAFLSTGGRSDSAVFFAVILEFIAFGFALDEAVAHAVRQLRQDYPASSYNCMIQSEDQLVVACATGRERTDPEVVAVYDRYGRGDEAHDYRVLRYRPLGAAIGGDGADGDADGGSDGADGAAAGAATETGATTVTAGDAGIAGAAGVVVASSGFAQDPADGWRDLPNNHLLVASNRTGDYRVRPI